MKVAPDLGLAFHDQSCELVRMLQLIGSCTENELLQVVRIPRAMLGYREQFHGDQVCGLSDWNDETRDDFKRGSARDDFRFDTTGHKEQISDNRFIPFDHAEIDARRRKPSGDESAGLVVVELFDKAKAISNQMAGGFFGFRIRCDRNS